MENIIEGNKLIAEFMGNKCNDDLWYMPNQSQFAFQGEYSYKMDTFYSKDLQYHSSWNWLMPVVEKIDNTLIEDTQLSTSINDLSFLVYGTHIFAEDKTKIDAVWKGIVKFIEWYNKQKENESNKHI